MLRRSFCLVAIAMLVILASSAFGQVRAPIRIAYYGDVQPNAPASCGYSNGEIDGVYYPSGVPYYWKGSFGNTALGSLVDDPEAIDGKAYRVYDNSGTDYLYWRTDGKGNHDRLTGATIVARVKTVSETNGSGNIAIRGSGLTSWYHWGDYDSSYAHVVEPLRGRETVLGVPNDGKYHILRLTAIGDENDLSGTAYNAMPYAEDFNLFTNGNLVGQTSQGYTWTGNAGSEISILDGQVKVIGTAPEGQTDLEAGANVHAAPDEFGKIHITCSAKMTVIANVQCSKLYVYNTAGIVIAGWTVYGTGGAGEIAGRANGYGPTTAAVPLGATAKALEMVIDVNAHTCEYWVNSTLIGTLPCPTPDAPSGTPGNSIARVAFTRSHDHAAGSPVCIWDDLAVQGSLAYPPVPPPGHTRTIKLYLDENTTPVVDIQNAAEGSWESDVFLMGSSTAEGMQDVYFDWVVCSSAGAFAPGEEEAVIGCSLPLEDTVVTTIAGCKTAPLNSQVQLTDAMISQSIYGNIGGGETGQLALAIEEEDRSSGIRVMTKLETFAGATHNITGAIAEVDGERVITPNTMFETLTMRPVLAPIAMNNAASGGGAFGFQQGVVKDATALSGAIPFTEAFSYPDSHLYNDPPYNDSPWTGAYGTGINVVGGAVKITGGVAHETASRSLSMDDQGTNKITITTRVKSGPSAGNDWYLEFSNSSDVNLAKWQGCGQFVNGRGTLNYSSAIGNLTGGETWNTLKVEINPSANTAQYYLNNVALGGPVPQDEAGNVLKKIMIQRYGYADHSHDTAVSWLDDITVTPDQPQLSPAMSTGLNNIGLYVTVFGKVTRAEWDLNDYWNSYFYVDDGSGLKDGTGNIGIRCRPAWVIVQFPPVPSQDSRYVGVTGVMGIQQINGVNCRVLRTWSFTDPYYTP